VTQLEDLRLAVYRGLADRGASPAPAELAVSLGRSEAEAEARADLHVLHDQRHLVLDAGGELVMAHPFGAVAHSSPSVSRSSTAATAGVSQEA
jgi:hypothetical protein